MSIEDDIRALDRKWRAELTKPTVPFEDTLDPVTREAWDEAWRWLKHNDRLDQWLRSENIDPKP